MPLAKHGIPVRVDLSTPGEWVELKPRLSKGDEKDIEGAAFKLHSSKLALVGGESPDIDLTLDLKAAAFIGLEVGIVAWSLDDPLTPANIRELLPEDYDIITARANELWEPRADAEKKASSGTGAPTPSGEGPPPPTSNGP